MPGGSGTANTVQIQWPDDRFSPSSVSAAAPHSPPRTPAQSSAGERVSSVICVRVVETNEFERVYNLTVAGEHEYFANGVLVSNCDAGRYGFAALTHYLTQLPGDRPVPGTRAAFQLEEAKIEQELDKREARLDALAEQDELAEEYRHSGEYEWQ